MDLPKTREGTKSGRGCLQRMKLGNGIKDRDDKSRGIEIFMTESFAKINPTDPLILGYQSLP
jgi:hypothetical protein